MFTQLNQYRLILEVKPEFRRQPHDLSDIYIRPPAGGGLTPTSTAMMPTSNAIDNSGQQHHCAAGGECHAGGKGLTRSARSRASKDDDAAVGEPPGAVPRRDGFVQPGADASLGDAVEAIDKAKAELGMPASIQGGSRERPRRSKRR